MNWDAFKIFGIGGRGETEVFLKRRIEDGAARKQAVLGLDFGTLFTKVVIGIDDLHYAVPLLNRKDRYFLPSRFGVDDKGYANLDADHSVLDGHKLRILNEENDEQLRVEAVIFLSLTIRRALLWFGQELGKTYRKQRIDWQVNAGLPTVAYENPTLTHLYRRLVRAAWAMAWMERPLTVELATMMWRNTDENRTHLVPENEGLASSLLGPDSLSVFPEFVAQVAGYTRTPARKPDIHALVDIGGGTLDVTIFNVWRESGEDVFPIFARAVERLGTQYLHKHRERLVGHSLALDAFGDMGTQFAMATQWQISLPKLRRSDTEFCDRMVEVIGKQLAFSKLKRYPKSRSWVDGIPCFVCGGGARVDVFDAAINEFANTNGVFPIELTPLQKPDSLIGPKLTEDEFSRLLVAFGLSFDALDIGKIVKAGHVPDQDQWATDASWRDSYIEE